MKEIAFVICCLCNQGGVQEFPPDGRYWSIEETENAKHFILVQYGKTYMKEKEDLLSKLRDEDELERAIVEINLRARKQGKGLFRKGKNTKRRVYHILKSWNYDRR